MIGLIQEVEQIAERVCMRVIEERGEREVVLEQNLEAAELRRRLAEINAKENISKKEAAFLLSCSEGHLRNLVAKAKKKQTPHPIPFNDLDGTVSFKRIDLMAWAAMPKEKRRSHLSIAK